MTLQLQVRSFSFSLLQPLRTAPGVVAKRRGWLLRLCDGDTGAVGWGEVAPLRTEQWLHCKILMGALPEEVSRGQLEVLIHQGPGAFGFGLGAALAELDGLVGDLSSQPWQEAPPPGSPTASGRSDAHGIGSSSHGLPVIPLAHLQVEGGYRSIGTGTTLVGSASRASSL